MAVAVKPDTRTGTGLLARLPLPSRPSDPSPQDQTVPSSPSANPLEAPPAMAVMVDRPDTGAGIGLLPAVPLPRSPLVPLPQAQTGGEVVVPLTLAPVAVLPEPSWANKAYE